MGKRHERVGETRLERERRSETLASNFDLASDGFRRNEVLFVVAMGYFLLKHPRANVW